MLTFRSRRPTHTYGEDIMATVAVTDETFDAEVRSSDVPVVVDFWAEWCGPCKQIGPALEELAAEYDGRIKVAKVDVDSNPNTAAAMGVRGIPALFLFKDGQPISNKTGAAPKAALKKWIEEAI
nr:thioredoxin [Poseidonocella pacifica]